LHIDIKLQDGSVADSTRVNRQPTIIRMGQEDVTDKFEAQLLGMKVGDKKSFLLGPEDAFGHANPANIHKLPRNRFAQTMVFEVGSIIEFEQMTGDKLLGIVRSFNDEEVVADFNHPLCGQTLEFTVEIVDIQ
jgi:FKBP-type peptidyl-prolyl cis-trans isomerase SlpA